jgi:Protein of unknown function (DUF1153)
MVIEHQGARPGILGSGHGFPASFVALFVGSLALQIAASRGTEIRRLGPDGYFSRFVRTGLGNMMDTDLPSGAQYCAPETNDHGPKKAIVSASGKGRKNLRLNGLQLEDLPPPGVTRWVIRRKAQLVAAVEAGIISLDDALLRYSVSPEEFASWQRSFQRHGIYGLRTTRSQIYRTSRSAGDGGNKS